MDNINCENWMSLLSSEIRNNVSLSCLTIPGSHDSGASGLDLQSPVANDQPRWLRDMGDKVAAIKRAIYNWSRTQSMDVSAQLLAGIRYFDLRVSVPPDTQTVRIVHGLYADDIANTLVSILEFLTDHTSEVVLIDLNHFYGFTQTNHAELIELITTLFDSILCPTNVAVELNHLTLNFMSMRGYRAIVFYQTQDDVTIPIQLWPRSSISSPWADTDKLDKLIPYLAKTLAERKTKHQFFVTQGILTPRVEDVIKNLTGSLEKDIADKTTRRVVEWLIADRERLKNANIVICDFVEKWNFIKVVISMNLRCC